MPKRTRIVYCRLTASGELILAFPYRVQLINALKAAVPFRCRTWDPTRKVWTIDSTFVDLAITLLLEHYPDAEVPRRPRMNTTKAGTKGSDYFDVLHLTETAPPELVHAAFRCLAKLIHPDVGGDAESMRRLTEAHDALSRGLSA